MAEMRMVRWMCGVKLQDRVPSKGLRERLGLGDIISVWYYSKTGCDGITGFVQTLESPRIKMLRFPGLESPGKRRRSWKTLEKS